MDEEEWGDLGFIISGRDLRGDGKSLTKESYTNHEVDYIVVTPHWKELSWLFRNTYQYVEKGTLSGGAYEEGFWAACTGFFLLNKEKPYQVKELLFFVLDFLVGMERRSESVQNPEK